jgi:uncharacterized protein
MNLRAAGRPETRAPWRTGAPVAGRRVPPELAGVTILAVHNVVMHRLLAAPADAVLNLATAVGLAAFARRVGCSAEDLGIRPADAASGLRVGLAAAAVAGSAVALGAAVPGTRTFFDDRRVRDASRREVGYHLAVRIPLATALAEELQFRGALLALLRRERSPTTAILWTSLLFGAWHVLPTLEDYQGNQASALVDDPGRGQRLAVLAATVMTGAAGSAFAWLRLRSRSLVAPILAHATLNTSAYLVGRWVVHGREGVPIAGAR